MMTILSQRFEAAIDVTDTEARVRAHTSLGAFLALSGSTSQHNIGSTHQLFNQ